MFPKPLQGRDFRIMLERVLVWPAWPSSAGPHGTRGYSSCFLPREKFHPREIYASGRGLLVAPINAPQLLEYSKIFGRIT